MLPRRLSKRKAFNNYLTTFSNEQNNIIATEIKNKNIKESVQEIWVLRMTKVVILGSNVFIVAPHVVIAISCI